MRTSIRFLPIIAALFFGACGPTTYVVHQSPAYNPCDPQFYEPFSCQRAIGMGGYYYGSTYYPMSGGHTFVYYQQQEQVFVSKGGRPKPADATKLVFKQAPQSNSAAAAAAKGTDYKFTPKNAPTTAAPTGKSYGFTPKTPAAATPSSRFQTTKPPAPSAPATKSYTFSSRRK